MTRGTTRKKKTNYKGYLGIFRREKLLLKEKKLTLSHFGAFILFLLSADWDKDHSTFGGIPTDNEMETATGIDYTTWSRHRKFLYEQGLLLSIEGVFVIKNFWKYLPEHAIKLAKYDIASLQEEDAVLQELAARLQNKVAIMQNSPSSTDYGMPSESTDNTSQSIGSHAIMQQQNSPKETLNKSKENIEKLNDASHQEFSYRPEKSYPCENCGKAISGNIANYSYKKYKKALCFSCQSYT